MQQATIDSSDLSRLIEKLEKSPEVLAKAKRQAVEQAAPKLKQLVDKEIGGTGKVRSWQGQYVGSKGGYAAARPKAKTYTEPSKTGKRYAVGAVTNAINRGHRYPGQGARDADSTRGKTRKYITGLVKGRYFYEKAQDSVEGIAQKAADQVLQELKKYLGG